MKINYIKRKDLDIEKYDACIEQSTQSRIYAFSWYLDIVADKWDALVLEDYKAVMPIPWKRKFGIKYVVQPYFCQQLGVFSKDEFSLKKELLFLKKVKQKFLKISYSFNSYNFIDIGNTKRINYLLSLDKDYESLFKGFNKGRKHAVKKGIKNKLFVDKVSLENLLDIQSQNYVYAGFNSSILERIIEKSLKNKTGFLQGVFFEDELLGGTFFIKTEKAIYYLFSTYSAKGKKLQAPSFMINYILEKYSNSDLIFDFEGGNLPNIATFFKSFGTKKEFFFQLKRF
jgi:hypothetical protein